MEYKINIGERVTPYGVLPAQRAPLVRLKCDESRQNVFLLSGNYGRIYSGQDIYVEGDQNYKDLRKSLETKFEYEESSKKNSTLESVDLYA